MQPVISRVSDFQMSDQISEMHRLAMCVSTPDELTAILRSKRVMVMRVIFLQAILLEENLSESGDHQYRHQYHHKILHEQIKILRCPRFAIQVKLG
jgi:hypothetical protein